MRRVAAVAVLAFAGCGASAPGTLPALAPARVARSASSHVAVIVMENKEASDVLGSRDAPFLTRLARRYAVAADSFAIAHPSLPNYLALTSGSTHGIASDCTDCVARGPNLVDRLEGAAVSWRAYLEDLPRPCFLGASSGGYAKKHDPFAYYPDVAGNPRRCAKLVPLTRLARDLRAGTLPRFAWISPNLCDDTHDCGVRTGDRFLARVVPALLRGLGPRGYVVITYDEGTSDAGCCGGQAHGGRVLTVLAGPGARRGARSTRPVDHYGVLATIERTLRLAPVGAAADPANGSLDGLLRRG